MSDDHIVWPLAWASPASGFCCLVPVVWDSHFLSERTRLSLCWYVTPDLKLALPRKICTLENGHQEWLAELVFISKSLQENVWLLRLCFNFFKVYFKAILCSKRALRRGLRWVLPPPALIWELWSELNPHIWVPITFTAELSLQSFRFVFIYFLCFESVLLLIVFFL